MASRWAAACRLPRGIAAALCALLSLGAFAAGVALSAFHPLWPSSAMAAFVLWVALAAWRPALWLLVLPAALPLLNLSPWTGWIVFEEFDLLVLGAIAGGYLRWAFDAPKRDPVAQRPAWRLVPHAVGLGLGALGLVGLVRGFADAGVAFGWFQGYADPLNSLRIVKPLAYALLLWPLLHRQLRVSTAHATRQFGVGMLLGLALVSLAVVWERAAFPGLWDFSTTYRSTALFWEMHVGGAAIDAYLALAMPFVAWGLWSARTPWQWSAAAALALVACYACLTTFSRGVYLAVGLPLLLLGLLLLARRLDFRARAVSRRVLAYAALVVSSAVVLFVALQDFGAVGVLVVLLFAFALISAVRRRLAGWRTAAGLGLALALMLEVVAVFGTGSFMASRLAASDRDFGSRLTHWGNGLGLLYSPADWAWGIGLGRLPAHYARFVADREFSGAVQWVDESAGHHSVKIFGPKTLPELGGLFALTQRVPMQPVARYRVAFDARVLGRAELAASVCEMHLLYEGRCQTAKLRLRPGATSWQHHEVALRGARLPAGELPAPRLRVFALTVIDAGAHVEIDNLRLVGDGSPNLLHNADFSRQLAHWLPAAQSYFVPWHIDNLYLELLIERGLAGLMAFTAVAALALWNLLAGPARLQAVAPFLAASLCGALTVGLVSSVLDVPRVALLFLLLVFVALSMDEADSSH